MMIVVIDNYDSFTYNLVQYLSELGADVRVYRNDAVSVTELGEQHPDGIVISPGPGGPGSAGISCDAIRAFSGRIPILGVCLGHQCVGRHSAERSCMHGPSCTGRHRGSGTTEKGSSP